MKTSIIVLASLSFLASVHGAQNVSSTEPHFVEPAQRVTLELLKDDGRLLQMHQSAMQLQMMKRIHLALKENTLSQIEPERMLAQVLDTQNSEATKGNRESDSDTAESAGVSTRSTHELNPNLRG
jgi:hypothetical protein